MNRSLFAELSFGFPFWIAFAWLYEFTPEGIKRASEVEPHESIRDQFKISLGLLDDR